MRVRRCVLISIGLGILLAAPAAVSFAAENGWVRGEIRLNVRTGPGTQFKIVGVAKTGDGVEILERQEGWTKILIRADSGRRISNTTLSP